MADLSYIVMPAKSKVLPILISIPHSGVLFPKKYKNSYIPRIIEHPEDTDWFVDELYSFAPEMGITLIKAPYSRYVIDLNRRPDGKSLYQDDRVNSELVPTKTFSGKEIFAGSVPVETQVQNKLELYYWPFYQKIEEELKKLQKKYQHVLLFDAHSIKKHVPSISPKPFPDLILGSNDQQSADTALIDCAISTLKQFDEYRVEHNVPFKGGNLIRHFGQPQNCLHALQLEMAQTVYMDEDECRLIPERTKHIRVILKKLLMNLAQCLEQFS